MQTAVKGLRVFPDRTGVKRRDFCTQRICRLAFRATKSGISIAKMKSTPAKTAQPLNRKRRGAAIFTLSFMLPIMSLAQSVRAHHSLQKPWMAHSPAVSRYLREDPRSMIRIKRVHYPVNNSDGTRLLVERL